MEEQKTLVIPAYDAMVFPILCVLILFAINREGTMTRNEAYTTGAILILLYLPFTRHSLEAAEQGVVLRQSIWPRRRFFAWAELAGFTYRITRSGERARLTIRPLRGRCHRISLDLSRAETAARFQDFIAQARLHLGPDSVVAKPPLAR